MRFRKSIRIAKGLRINLSGSGLSLSSGVKGMSLTLGQNGAYINMGIPGTGIYDRKRIWTNENNKYEGNRLSNEVSYNVSLDLDEKGNPYITLIDSNHQLVNDEAFIRKFKKTELYKESLKKLNEEKRKEIEEALQLFIGLYKLTPSILRPELISRERDNLKLKTYKRKNYNEPKPDDSDIKYFLELEAINNVKTIFFWKKKELIQQYVKDRFHERKKEKIEAWENKRDDFIRNENLKEQEYNNAERNIYEELKSNYDVFLDGSGEEITKKIDTILNSINLPVEFSIDFELSENLRVLFVDIDLPEIEDLPKEKAIELSSGKISIKGMTQKEQNCNYLTCVTGLAFFFAGILFNTSAKIEALQISGYSTRLNKKNGNLEDEYIYSVKFERNRFEKMNFTNIDPYEAITSFDCKINVNNSFEMKVIQPFGKET